jgi:hypothetical protein
MRTRSLLVRRADPPSDASPGLAALLRSGFVVPLGPGLAGGGSLAQRTLARLEARLLRGLALPRAHLAASDGDALVNLALHMGAADGLLGGEDASAGPRGAVALGAGYRMDAVPAGGLFGLALFRRLDAVLVRHESAPAADPTDALREALVELGLADDAPEQTEADGGERRTIWRMAVADGGAPHEFLRRVERPLDGGASVVLVSSDLHTVLGLLAERHHDDRGLCWPEALAPFDVGLLSLVPDGRSTLEKLLPELQTAGLDVLLDDRPGEAPGARAELLSWGLPRLVMAGPRTDQGEVLVESRAGGTPERVHVADLAAHLGAAGDPATRRRALL